MDAARNTLAAFLYPKDALKSLDHFGNKSEVISNCNNIQEILYHYSNDKMIALL